MRKPPSVDSKNFRAGFRQVKESLAKVLLSDGRQPKVTPSSPLNICFDDTNFALPSAFTVIGTICPKNWARPQINF